MKILMVNKFFYIKGGSETYYFSLRKKLKDEGHSVIDFSMKDDKNFESKYSGYFVENVNYDSNYNLKNKMKAAANIIYSIEAKHKIEKLIKAEKPDIAHLHIFQHQISPSIIDVLNRHRIPIVYTAHDLKMICPNYKMMNNYGICEKCKKHKYYYCFILKCIKNSYLKSAVCMLEAYIHMIRKTYDRIQYIITPSAFYREKFIEFGVPEEKIIHIPNFLSRTEEKKKPDIKDYYLYFGRISEEKGVKTLIEAFKTFDKKLFIVGTGPEEEKLKNYVKKEQLENIIFKGFKSGDELKKIVREARCVIIPSEWYENGPYSAIEALQMRKPLIGADIAGIPELINNGENGYVFKSRNVDSLKEALGKMESLSPEDYNKYCEESYLWFLGNYTEEIHYKRLMNVYNNILKNKER